MENKRKKQKRIRKKREKLQKNWTFERFDDLLLSES